MTERESGIFTSKWGTKLMNNIIVYDIKLFTIYQATVAVKSSSVISKLTNTRHV